jgi:hypothetical protein
MELSILMIRWHSGRMERLFLLPSAAPQDPRIDAFIAHAAVGFFCGAMLDDPAGLLEGAGKRMRHVKLRWKQAVDEAALGALIEAAYRDIRVRLAVIG